MESYFGYIKNISDALKLIEATRLGLIPLIQRRLTSEERLNIRSGSIFVFNASNPGLKRWTDGMRWSASRFNGHFLTYTQKNAKYINNELIKKAITIVTRDDKRFGLISYYTNTDIDNNNLKNPSKDTYLNSIVLPKNYYFRKVTHTSLINGNNYLLTPLDDTTTDEPTFNSNLNSIPSYSKVSTLDSNLQTKITPSSYLTSYNPHHNSQMIEPTIYNSFLNYNLLSQHSFSPPSNSIHNNQLPILPPIPTTTPTLNNERSYSTEDQRQLKAINSFFN